MTPTNASGSLALTTQRMRAVLGGFACAWSAEGLPSAVLPSCRRKLSPRRFGPTALLTRSLSPPRHHRRAIGRTLHTNEVHYETGWMSAHRRCVRSERGRDGRGPSPAGGAGGTCRNSYRVVTTKSLSCPLALLPSWHLGGEGANGQGALGIVKYPQDIPLKGMRGICKRRLRLYYCRNSYIRTLHADAVAGMLTPLSALRPAAKEKRAVLLWCAARPHPLDTTRTPVPCDFAHQRFGPMWRSMPQ